MPGLDQGILNKGATRLGDFRDTELGLRPHFPVFAKYVFELGDLPRIVTGNYQPWALSLTHVYP